MPSFRLTLAYDGTDYAGSQAQPNQRTVRASWSGTGGWPQPRSGQSAAGGPIVGVHAIGQCQQGSRSSAEHDCVWSATSAQNASPQRSRHDRCGPGLSHSASGSTPHGVNIATGSRPQRLGAHSLAATRTRRTDLETEVVQAGAGAARGDATTSRYSRVEAKAFLGPSERRDQAAPHGGRSPRLQGDSA